MYHYITIQLRAKCVLQKSIIQSLMQNSIVTSILKLDREMDCKLDYEIESILETMTKSMLNSISKSMSNSKTKSMSNSKTKSMSNSNTKSMPNWVTKSIWVLYSIANSILMIKSIIVNFVLNGVPYKVWMLLFVNYFDVHVLWNFSFTKETLHTVLMLFKYLICRKVK